MTRPISATIHLPAMRENFLLAKKSVPGARLFAVIKANGYGHGLTHASVAFSEADGFAMIELEPAMMIRESGWKKPLLLLEGFFHENDIPGLAEHSIAFAVHCEEQLSMLEKTRLSQPVDVHLKMNTGMNRLGFSPKEYKKAYERLKAIPSVRSISFMTHFANAEVPSHPKVAIDEQLAKFDEATAGLKGERNLSNSAAILLRPDIRTDWVRPGIMLYGASPGGKTAAEYGLKPAMTLASEIIQLQKVPKGESVGYGSLYTADRDMTVGIVACGYADGYPRTAKNGTPVLVNGVRCPLAGRVSMDMLAVDVTGVKDVAVGSPVELWGTNIPIDEVAEASGTLGYELMCALSTRPRIVVEP